MNAEDLSFMRLPGAHQVLVDCRAIAAHVGVPLASVHWQRDVAPTGTPYHLFLTFSGITAVRKPEFTLDQITGYLTGQTTAEVKEMLRVTLESVLPDLEEH
jgi:hypothetical protein